MGERGERPVFVQAFEKGIAAYFRSLTDADALTALRLTLLMAAVAVPLNTVFGVAAAWGISKFGRRARPKGSGVVFHIGDEDVGLA